MSKINDGGPAFSHDGGITTDGSPIRESEGMSLRDYFAGEALKALMSCPRGGEPHLWYEATADKGLRAPDSRAFVIESHCQCWANAAYQMADAMLKAREAQ